MISSNFSLFILVTWTKNSPKKSNMNQNIYKKYYILKKTS